MLITDKGCCGRLGSVVTDAIITPTPRQDRERCLFRHDGSCRKCEARCPAEALTGHPFDRHACYDRLLENVRRHIGDKTVRKVIHIPDRLLNIVVG